MDTRRYAVSGVGCGLVGKMDVSLGGLDQGVTQELGDGDHVHAVHGGDRGPAMEQVMKPQSGQSRLVANAVPMEGDVVDGLRRRTGGKEITGNRRCSAEWRR